MLSFRQCSRALLLLSCGSLLALATAGPALATHAHPSSSAANDDDLVPVFKQCRSANAVHAPGPFYGTPSSCNYNDSPQYVSAIARTGPQGSGNVRYAVSPTAGNCGNPDICVSLTDTDIQTPGGADYDPTGTNGNDLRLGVTVRISDDHNCAPIAPPNYCNGGPYDQFGTLRDFDFPGGVPINCVPNGDPASPPGSDCSLSTTWNTLTSGSVTGGRSMVIQNFRTRVFDADGALFQQQGLFVP